MCCFYKTPLKWTVILSSIIFALCRIGHVLAIRKGRLMCPSSFVALSGDLHVQLQYTSITEYVNRTNATQQQQEQEHHQQPNTSATPSLTTSRSTVGVLEEQDNALTNLVISIMTKNGTETVSNISLYPDPRNNVTQISVPCQTFYRGGEYTLQVISKTNNSGSGSSIIDDERLKQQLDVRWPVANMQVTPNRLVTYPEIPVEVKLSFDQVQCDLSAGMMTLMNLPEFWLELIYCGKELTCASHNDSRSNILYAEEIRGFPKHKLIKLRCELFGLAGNYAVRLRPIPPTPAEAVTSAAIQYISVDWSNKFVFNVYARSIFPCDPHTGIGVLYEYPACILEQGDRVRLFAKLRADVASLKPPTSLHYVAEQRVVKSQYSLYFNCELFSEKYVEYCFVYVSQGISGAVADVRMDCVPTLPVKESDTGGWGPWSDWTACSTNCLGGTRNRYRFCDSPPPRYGAKFCEGPSVETAKCGKSISDTWDCIYESTGKSSTANRTDVSQEIGPGCRCGCIVHLGSSKPKRIIAGATQSCPGRSFWLIQVDGDDTISFEISFLRLPCVSQYIKIRNGPSLSSALLTELISNDDIETQSTWESTGQHILVEFYSGDSNLIEASCTGGFLANIEQIQPSNQTNKIVVRSRAVIQAKMKTNFTLVHLSAVVFASIIILISALLGAQYIVRYRKYHLAISERHDHTSPIHTPMTSMGSLHNPPSRAVSTTTLLSEVIYMVKIRPKRQLRHSILRESIDAENLAKETEMNDTELLTKCDEMGSNSSIVTLRNEINTEDSLTNSPEDQKDSASMLSGVSSSASTFLRLSKHSKYPDRDDGTLKRKSLSPNDDSIIECSSIRSHSIRDSDRFSQMDTKSISASLTNGCYSPAASIVSRATIRTTNQKESKEKQNRRKLLARPGSEFSLGNPEDFELDYYDYDVINAGAAPGSYLGMDPAYLVWIPPMDEETNIDEVNKTPEPIYEEILPRPTSVSPESNTETPESELSRSNSVSKVARSPSETNLKNVLIQKSIAAAASVSHEGTPILSVRRIRTQKPNNQEKSTARLSSESNSEKETSVVKSPSDLQDFYELDDIQFADEESESSEHQQIKALAPRVSYLKTVAIDNQSIASSTEQIAL
ncbi:uncharacterized protein LOC129940590 [Eupeodes corollae]|uniref:uncharacterized protein LOC129940590 n=1 Tax=Eupeodes corollae TaxID=290404 RepID=UPI002490FD05|nr:uncharacterized protein LOC129940590 [Eupeodes corollae]XP_055904949.1 uncharacterized protein LOC129940590 [Eupeodes corollae]